LALQTKSGLGRLTAEASWSLHS